MNRKTKLCMFLMLIFSCLILAGCSKQADVNLNDYVSFEYDGFDGNGTVRCSVDYNKLLTDNENTLGEKNSMSALRLLRKIEVKADKEEKLSNNETITVSFGNVNKDELLSECDLNVSFSEFTATVSGLKELEKIDLFKNLNIKTSGKDTRGNAYISSYDLPYEYYFLEYKLEKNDNLSNGEKVKVTVKATEGDIDQKLAELGKAALSKEYYYTVTGLEELNDYDPFNGITVKFKGLNGEGTAELEKDYLVNDYVYSWDYVLDKEEGLKNGDIVTVRVESSYPDETLEESASYRGLKMSSTSKEYTVDGLAQPLSDTAELDPVLFDLMKMDDIDKIEAYFAKGESRSVEPGSLLDVKYIGSIIMYQEPTSWTEERNSLYNIYRCDVKCSFDEQRWVYWYSLYDGITRNDDGSFNIPEPKCPSDDYTVGTYSVNGEVFVTEDKSHFYLGYETYSTFRAAHIRNESLAIFDDVNDSDKEHINPAFALLNIEDKNGAYVLGMADFSNIGAVPIYHNGTYTITLKLQELKEVFDAPAEISGLNSFKVSLLNEYDGVKGSIDINGVKISGLGIVCDGKPVDVAEENVLREDGTDSIVLWLFDTSKELTGKNAAVKSKGFGFKDTIEVTITVDGINGVFNGSTDGTGDVTDGTVDVTDGTGDVTDGTGDVTDGTGDVTDGTGDVTDGTGDVTDGIDDITDGTDDITDGTGDVTDGTGDITDGTGDVTDETGDITDGTGDGTGDVTDGTNEKYDIVIERFGDDRVRMIKLINDYTKIGLIASKNMVDDVDMLPVVIMSTDDKELAERIKTEFEKYGALVSVKNQ